MEKILSRLAAEAKNLGAPEGRCPQCDSQGCFKQHDWRQRQLRVIIGSVVGLCLLTLKRWKCQECGKTFTHYPDFVVPNKRYILGAILSLSEEYLQQDALSYRAVVQPERQAFGYAETQDGHIDDRQLSHSTVWQWLSWLGGMLPLLAEGLDLLRQKDPEFSLHRQAIAISPQKYRSTRRKKVLEHAAQLLQVAPAFRHVFAKSIFPTVSNSRWPAAG